ncbi:MAG: alpha/beta hydrolase [Acidimicrobiales bacterium]
MDFAQLYDPALDAHVSEMRALNEQFNKRAANAGGDLSTPEGLAKARDLNALMGGLFAGNSTIQATTRQVPGTTIGLRVITPAAATPTALYIDIHGGGFFIGDATMSDALNASIADAANAVSVSIDYRLAPEHPYPAPPDDCETAALWILENAASEWGVDRFAIGGASAGGNLVAVTLQRLRDRHDATSSFLAANMQFGVYDLSGTPSQIDLGRVAFRDLYLPTTPAAQRKVADISPLYGNLRGMPPALFTVGTLDYLYDDSLFMAARWHAAGNETELAVYPESIHGFTAFPAEMSRIASRRIVDFIASHLR